MHIAVATGKFQLKCEITDGAEEDAAKLKADELRLKEEAKNAALRAEWAEARGDRIAGGFRHTPEAALQAAKEARRKAAVAVPPPLAAALEVALAEGSVSSLDRRVVERALQAAGTAGMGGGETGTRGQRRHAKHGASGGGGGDGRAGAAAGGDRGGAKASGSDGGRKAGPSGVVPVTVPGPFAHVVRRVGLGKEAVRREMVRLDTHDGGKGRGVDLARGLPSFAESEEASVRCSNNLCKINQHLFR